MRLVNLLLLFYSSLTCAQSHVCGEQCSRAKLASSEQIVSQLAAQDDNSFDLKYYRFEWNIDPNVRAIAGKATLYFTMNQPRQRLDLSLSSQLVVDSVIYHGRSTSFTQMAPYGLTLNLPVLLQTFLTDSVTIAYHGVPPITGFGSFSQSFHNGEPEIWTLSEPYGSRDWWPCKNGLTDKIDSIDFLVTTPSQYKVATSGKLLSRVQNGLSTTFHWKHKYPIAPYLVAVAVTNFAEYKEYATLGNGVNMEVHNFVYPEHEQDARVETAKQLDVLEWLDSLFVTYPFFREKYGHAEFGRGGGMEHQTMSFITGFNYHLLVHELAHQWFGDYVTCGSWEDIWLNEGFATYIELLATERFIPSLWLQARRGIVNSVTSQPGGSVFVADTTDVWRTFDGRLSYHKAGYLLRMLQWKLGDEDFFNGVRLYLNERAFGFSRTSHLKSALERSSGKNLTGFFNDWLYGEGYPSYVADVIQSGNLNVSLVLSQSRSSLSVGFFEMPVPIRFYGQGRDTTLVFEHDFSGQAYGFSLPFVVDSVKIDPELWLISANNQHLFLNNLEAGGENRLRVFPNPASNGINLSISTDKQDDFSFTITNSLGQVVAKFQQNIALGETNLPIDVCYLSSGRYILTASSKSSTWRVDFVKH